MEMFKQIMLVIAKVLVQAVNAVLNPTAKYLTSMGARLELREKAQMMRVKAMKMNAMKLGASKSEEKK